jgi:hypothetical protein
MIDCSTEMTGYYDDEVALPSTARTQMRDHRDANRKRLRNGLTKAEKAFAKEFPFSRVLRDEDDGAT